MNERHIHIEFRGFDTRTIFDLWVEALLVTHQDKIRLAEEKAAKAKLVAAQRQFLLDTGWAEKANGWWLAPHRYYRGKHAGLYHFDHAVNSMQWVLREKRHIV